MKKSVVLLLLLTTLFSVSACGKEKAKTSSSSVVEPTGICYTLQEAYDLGLITQEHLLSIAYYSGNANVGMVEHLDDPFNSNQKLMGEHYRPIPQTFILDENIKLEIETIFLEYFNSTIVPFYTSIKENYQPKYLMYYYGTYDDCVAVRFGYDVISPLMDHSEMVGGVMFSYLNGCDFFADIFIYHKQGKNV